MLVRLDALGCDCLQFVWHMLGQHVRHPAPERVVDPAGAAGRDGDIEALIGALAEGRAGHRRRAHRERADHKSFAFHGRPLPIARPPLSARRGQRHALS